MTCISIYLTRDASGTNDDVITIRKNTDYNEFEIVYTDPNEGSEIKHKMSGMYRKKVLEYIYLLLKNLYLDEQKFKNVQFNMPAMPRMIVACTKFSDLYYREHIEELIEFGLDTLENVEVLKKPVGNYYYTPTEAALNREVMNREVERSLGGRGRHLFFD